MCIFHHIPGNISGGRDRRGRSLSMVTSCSSPNLGLQDQSSVSTPTAVIKTKLQLVDLAGSECVGKILSLVLHSKATI